MDRREFLESIGALTALAPFAATLHARAQAGAALRTLTPAHEATVSGLAEILLPQTDTVGAAQVGVSRFIDLLLSEAMTVRDRDRFLEGLAAIDARSRSLYGTPAAAARRQDQEALLRALDDQLPARAPTKAQKALLDQQPVTAERGYELLKQLVVFAYFSSEPVARGLINAPIIPGRYDGCVSA